MGDKKIFIAFCKDQLKRELWPFELEVIELVCGNTKPDMFIAARAIGKTCGQAIMVKQILDLKVTFDKIC